MKQLCVADLHKAIQQRQEKKKDSFNRVLELCFKKIETCAKLHHIGCFFDVPEFLIGYPLFNLNECIIYVYNSLVKNGFHVKYIFPRILYITWTPPPTNNNMLLEHATTNNTVLSTPAAPVVKPVGAKRGRKKKVQENGVAQFKPSGKFVLNLT